MITRVMLLLKFNNIDDVIKIDILSWQFFKLCYPQINFNFFTCPIFSFLNLAWLEKKEKTEKNNYRCL